MTLRGTRLSLGSSWSSSLPFSTSLGFSTSSSSAAAFSPAARRRLYHYHHRHLFSCPINNSNPHPHGSYSYSSHFPHASYSCLSLPRHARSLYDCCRDDSSVLLKNFPTKKTGQRHSSSSRSSSDTRWSTLSTSSTSSTRTSVTSSTTTTSSSSRLLHDALWNPTEEHRALRNMLRSFVEKEVEPQANDSNAAERFHRSLFTQLGHLGLLGVSVPPQYGGAGLDATAVVMVHEELASSDPALCLSYLAHALLLVNNVCVNSDCEDQKQRFLPGWCDGSRVGGMGMSEAGAGTDVLGGMSTTGTYMADQDAWVLHGHKFWITNGYLVNNDDDCSTTYRTGDAFLIYAKTGPQKTDLTSFLVEAGMSGFSLGQRITNKLGMRASPTAELVLDHVVLPPGNTHVVGPVHGALSCMMRNLELERLALAAMSLGIARRCLNEMKQYALERSAFGQANLYAFGQVQRFLAESYVEYMAGRSYVYNVAQCLSQQQQTTPSSSSSYHYHHHGLDADGAKLYCAAMAKTIADRAIQVLGGNGYTGDYKVERFWRDAKLLEIGGGTNESHHKNIARDLRKLGSTWIE